MNEIESTRIISNVAYDNSVLKDVRIDSGIKHFWSHSSGQHFHCTAYRLKTSSFHMSLSDETLFCFLVARDEPRSYLR